jgi:hypothetical protein
MTLYLRRQNSSKTEKFEEEEEEEARPLIRGGATGQPRLVLFSLPWD